MYLHFPVHRVAEDDKLALVLRFLRHCLPLSTTRLDVVLTQKAYIVFRGEGGEKSVLIGTCHNSHLQQLDRWRKRWHITPQAQRRPSQRAGPVTTGDNCPLNKLIRFRKSAGRRRVGAPEARRLAASGRRPRGWRPQPKAAPSAGAPRADADAVPVRCRHRYNTRPSPTNADADRVRDISL